MDKPAVLAINKIDIDGADEKVEVVMEQLKNMKGIDVHWNREKGRIKIIIRRWHKN